MLKERTLSELRRNLKGRIYIYCHNEKIGKQFLQNAENEGYNFEKTKPADNGWSNIVALKHNKQLSFVGFCGHMAFQCNGGDNPKGFFHRIDYKKFINNDTDYFFRTDNYSCTIQFKSNLFGNVTIIGSEGKNAIDYINKYISLCKSKIQEIALYDTVTNLFDVVITDYKYLKF